jgi:hypothetical protein
MDLNLLVCFIYISAYAYHTEHEESAEESAELQTRRSTHAGDLLILIPEYIANSYNNDIYFSKPNATPKVAPTD